MSSQTITWKATHQPSNERTSDLCDTGVAEESQLGYINSSVPFTGDANKKVVSSCCRNI